MEEKIILELKNIKKNFVKVQALKGVDFKINQKEIVGLVGANGAGKSTLVSIIAGVHKPTSGEILWENKKIKLSSPNEAQEKGIRIVHQEPALIPNMNAVENIFLGEEIYINKLILDKKTMREEAKKLFSMLDIPVNLDKKICSMGSTQTTAIAIAKTLIKEPKLLILDEVTSALEKQEVENLFKIIKNLRKLNMGVIFISHRLSEVTEICDRVVVLRNGKKVSELSKKEISKNKIIQFMVGKEFLLKEKRIERNFKQDNNKETFFECKNLGITGLFENVTFKLEKGEILGLVGLKGSGRSELAKSIFGILPYERGEMIFKGRQISPSSSTQAIDLGIGYIPSDRIKEGLAEIKSIEENINIMNLETCSNKMNCLDFSSLNQIAKNYIERLKIKTPSAEEKVMNLSGGNQQKVMIAKYLTRKFDLFIFDSPTRGVDVAAKDEIHNLIFDLKKENKGIIIISPEIRELMYLCDKILVMNKYGIQGLIEEEQSLNEEDILNMLHSSSISKNNYRGDDNVV